jgi:hypothetical protein
VQLDFYGQFVKTHGSKVRLRTFERLKPYYIRRLQERNKCAYKYHVNMLELKDVFNNMLNESKGVHWENCECDVCVVSQLHPIYMQG